MELKSAFASALLDLRALRNLTQEDFTGVSSRTNLSLLERSKTIPTIEKLSQICGVLDVHPLTLMAICYSKKEGLPASEILAHVADELESLDLR
ncbi:helix-turn-helix domain-containing protein [Pseudomonas bohemica]|uniref:helix-turn-helix domain-containing protein n=1 Tax=Pseudomonas bohemica TaxID=2044872 RepID=UPI000DA6045A|nr:helix-turn-helix transcriptional regulator [Pseudomonas bohemica]